MRASTRLPRLRDNKLLDSRSAECRPCYFCSPPSCSSLKQKLPFSSHVQASAIKAITDSTPRAHVPIRLRNRGSGALGHAASTAHPARLVPGHCHLLSVLTLVCLLPPSSPSPGPRHTLPRPLRADQPAEAHSQARLLRLLKPQHPQMQAFPCRPHLVGVKDTPSQDSSHQRCTWALFLLFHKPDTSAPFSCYLHGRTSLA